MEIALRAHIAIIKFQCKAQNFFFFFFFYHVTYDIFKCQTKGGQCRTNTTFISHWLSSALTLSMCSQLCFSKYYFLYASSSALLNAIKNKQKKKQQPFILDVKMLMMHRESSTNNRSQSAST